MTSVVLQDVRPDSWPPGQVPTIDVFRICTLYVEREDTTTGVVHGWEVAKGRCWYQLWVQVDNIISTG